MKNHFQSEMIFLTNEFGFAYHEKSDPHYSRYEFINLQNSLVFETVFQQGDTSHELYAIVNGWKSRIDLFRELTKYNIMYSKVKLQLSKKYFFVLVRELILAQIEKKQCFWGIRVSR